MDPINTYKANARIDWKYILTLIMSIIATVLSILGFTYTHWSYEDVIKPHLYIGVGELKSPIPGYGLFIQNNGRGPAKIDSITINYNGKQLFDLSKIKTIISKDWNQGNPGTNEICMKIENGMEINNGSEKVIYAFENPTSNETTNIVSFLKKRISIRITYSSQHFKKYKARFPE